METKISEVLNNALQNNNLDITSMLTHEERIEILNNKILYIDLQKYNQIKLRLFTKEEAQIQDEKTQEERRYIEYDVHLEDKRKLEILMSPETRKTLFYDYESLIKSIENNEYKKEAFKYIIENNTKFILMNYTEIITSFKNIDDPCNIIDEYLRKNENNKRILNANLNIAELYNNLEKTQFIKILKLIDKHKCIQEYKILNEVENKIELFEEIIKLPNYKKEHKALYELISKLNENDSFKAYNILIENDYTNLKNIEIIELLKNTTKNRKEEFIETLYKNIETDKLEIILAKYIENIPKTERRKEFKEYIINNDKFNSLIIAAYLKKETMLNCLDEVLIKIKDEQTDLKDLTKRTISYLENLNYDLECTKEEVNCKTLIEIIAKYNNLNKENLETIINRFGYQIFKYLNNDNIKELINLNKTDLDKILYMFNEENITIDAHKKDSIIESVIQREFMFLESHSYNIFSTFETLINKQSDELKNAFDEMIKRVFDKRPKKLQEICKNNKITIQELYENIKNGKNLEILHQITQQYIEIQREEYSKIRTPEFIKELDLDKKFKKEWIIKKYIEINDTTTIKSRIRFSNINLTEEQEKLKNDSKQLEYIIEFKKNPTKELMEKIEKKNLKIFNEILNMLYENEYLNDIPKEEKENAEYIYSFKKVKENYLIEILSQLDIKCIKENLIDKEENYNKILEILNKYKYLGFGTTFHKVADEIDLTINSQAIAGFINCFYRLYNECEDKEKFIENHTMTKLLEEGLCHELTSNKYAKIIGIEDFKLIFSNTGANRASATAQVRLDNILEIIPKMYNKEYITIPPINETITLKNGKKIKIEIGQPLDFTNLSVGERTGACLRAKGAFRDLWEFILTNKNGFNIIFKTPNDKFISRVSGIRNGNTIFENELRNSVLKEYTDDDLIEANQIVTKLIEDYTKMGNYPIENIIITSDNAMEKEKEKKSQITTNRKEAMFGLNFNYDKNDTFSGIILSNNGILKEIKLGKNDVDIYSVNKNTKTYYKTDAIEKIKQLKALNQLLNGIKIEDIEIDETEYDTKNLSCISNNEYYILKYKDEIIDTFILDKYKQNDRVLNEINKRTEGKIENSRNYH